MSSHLRHRTRSSRTPYTVPAEPKIGEELVIRPGKSTWWSHRYARLACRSHIWNSARCPRHATACSSLCGGGTNHHRFCCHTGTLEGEREGFCSGMGGTALSRVWALVPWKANALTPVVCQQCGLLCRGTLHTAPPACVRMLACAHNLQDVKG